MKSVILRNYIQNYLLIKGANLKTYERWSTLLLVFLSFSYSAILIPVFYWINMPVVGNVFIFLASCAIVIYWYFYKTKKRKVTAHLYGIATLIGFSCMTAYTGGLYSPLMMYQLISPIGTTLIATKKVGKIWTIFTLLWISILIIDHWFNIGIFISEPTDNPLVSIVAFLSLLFYLLSVVWTYETAKITFQKVIQKQNRSLTLKNEEIQNQNLTLANNTESIISSITYAKKIQDAVMHNGQSIQTSFSEAFIFFKPRDIVSGDFYWSDKIGSKKIIVTADCTGHGVPGAFLSLIGMYLLHSITREITEISPEVILKRLRSSIHQFLNQENSDSRDGMDIAICIVDKNEIKIASARSTIYCFQNGQILAYKGDNLMIGGNNGSFTNQSYSLVTLPLQEVDFVYMCSDGFQDQFGGQRNKKYMKNRMYSLFDRIALLSADQQKEEIQKEFISWKGDNIQVDDILILGFAPNS